MSKKKTRTKKAKGSIFSSRPLVLVGDLHLRATPPRARRDDYMRAQWAALEFIHTTAKDIGAAGIVQPGDFLHRYSAGLSFFFSVWTALKASPVPWYGIAGNHDVYGHALENLGTSALGRLAEVGAVRLLADGIGPNDSEGRKLPISGANYGTALPPMKNKMGPRLGVIHEMIHGGKNSRTHKSVSSTPAKRVLRNNPGYDVILSGDNHKQFVKRDGERILINPGSVFRTNADQVEHCPALYVWYPAKGKVKRVPFPMAAGDVELSREHIEKEDERQERMAAFVARLDSVDLSGMDFEENANALVRALPKKKIKAIAPLVQQSIEEARI